MSSDKQRRYAILGAVALLGGLGIAALLRPGHCAQSPHAAPEVMVFAAASLRDVLHDVRSAFTAGRTPETVVRFNIAGSNVLARQIVAASQADLFISANDEWMDYVDEAGRLVAGTRKAILSNRIVIIASRVSDWRIEAPTDLATLPLRYLALANPEAVPAGRYAKAYLEGVRYQGRTLWEALSGKVAPAADVRAALALVEADPAVVGMVYGTDAADDDDVRVLLDVPPSEMPPVRYSVARVDRPGAPPAAARFFDFLLGDRARAVFAEHGFVPIETGREAP